MKKSVVLRLGIVLSVVMLLSVTVFSASKMSPFSPYAKPITLTCVRVSNRGQQHAPGESGFDNGTLKAIEKLLNVKIKVLWEAAPGDDYNQKLNLMIASGKLPDFFAIDGVTQYRTFQALAENDKLADLTQAYNKCIGGRAAEDLKPYKGRQLINATFNGKIYGVPGPPTGYNHNLLWIRPDWLKKVGLPLPKTIDDIKNIAKAFVEKDPGGNGPGGTIGMCLSYWAGQPILGKSDSFWAPTPIMNAVGSFPRAWIKGKDGKVMYGTIAPETKKGLGILADWYKEGLIDKSFMTRKTVDEVTPYAREGKVGLVFCSWWWAYCAQSADPKVMVDWIPVMAPLNAQGKFEHTINMDATAFTCVSKKCKYPEAVIKAMNVQYDLEMGAYDDNPAIAAIIKPDIEYKTIGRTTSPFAGIAAQYDQLPRISHSIADYLKTGKLVYYSPKASDDEKKRYADALRYSKSPDLKDTDGYIAYIGFALAGVMMDAPENEDVVIAFSDATDSYADYWPALQKLEEEMEVQIVTGQKPLSYFDDFVAQWKKLGGDTITKEVQVIVDKRNKK